MHRPSRPEIDPPARSLPTVPYAATARACLASPEIFKSSICVEALDGPVEPDAADARARRHLQPVEEPEPSRAVRRIAPDKITPPVTPDWMTCSPFSSKSRSRRY